jgi:DNA-binding XRE family transcriptional regulator
MQFLMNARFLLTAELPKGSIGIMPRDWKAWGRRLQRLRQDRKLTQEALASRAGVARNTITRIEMGIRRPSVDLLERLAKALRLSVNDLLD